MRNIIVVLLFFCSGISWAQKKYRIFEQIDVENGLSSNWVRDIIQDDKGYIWMATSDGLNRFDGYTVKSYKHNEDFSSSLPVNNFHCLFFDSEKILWLAYNGGISKYDPASDGFIHFTHSTNNINSISSNKVSDITSDSKGNLWISTRDKGLCLLNKSTYLFKSLKDNKNELYNNQFLLKCDKKDRIWIGTYYSGIIIYNISTNTYSSANKNLPENVFVSALFESSNGTIWIGTSKHGLYYYDEIKGSFVKHNSIKTKQRILTLEEDHENNLWVSLENAGINIIDSKTNEISIVTHNPYIPNGIGHNSVNTILKDRDNNLWLGTFSSGVNLYKVPNNQFGHIFNDPINSSSLSHNSVLSFTEDSENNLWIGTDDGGLNKYNSKTGKFELYLKGNKPGNLTTNVIISLKEDNEKNLWVGSYADGLFVKEKSSNQFTKIISNVSIGSILQDHEGNIWFGCWGEGLYKYSLKTKQYTIYRVNEQNPTSISDDFIFYVYQDKKNKIWACTSLGLNLLEDSEVGKFRRFYNDKGNPRSIAGNIVYHCYEDSKNRFWISTDAGLSELNRDSSKFVNYKEKDGFANVNITGILEDNDDMLWLSHNKGLSKFNPETKQVKNYNKSDGLQNNQFNIKAQYKLSTGELLFGGTIGYNRFNPSAIQENKIAPNVIIKKVEAYKNTNEKNENAQKVFLHPTKEIIVSKSNSNLIFEFVAINYSNTQKVLYAYMLEGFDTDWNYTNTPNIVNYTNLGSGQYTFKVKAANEDGIWNEEGSKISIQIVAPFWQSKWFMGITLALLLFIGFKVYKNVKK